MIHLLSPTPRAQPCALRYTPEASGAIAARFSALEAAVRAKLSAQGFPAASVACERFLNLRFEGTDVAMMIPKPDDGDFGAAFVARYRREFGFTLDRPLAVDDVRVRGSAGGGALPADPAAAGAAPPPLPEPAAVRSVFFLQGGRQPTPVHRLGSLSPGHSVAGPALLVDSISTVVVEPGCTAHVTERGDLRIDVGAGGGSHKVTEELDPIQLAIFSHRFMASAPAAASLLTFLVPPLRSSYLLTAGPRSRTPPRRGSRSRWGGRSSARPCP